MSSARFVLPAPLQLSLGQLLILLCGAAVLLAVCGARLPSLRLSPLWVLGAMALLLPAMVSVLNHAVAGGTLGLSGSVFIPLALAATLTVTIPAFALLSMSSALGTARLPTMALLVASLAVGAAMSAALALAWRPEWGLNAGLAAAWAIPFAMLAAATGDSAVRPLVRWLATAGLAAIATIPFVALLQTEMRVEVATREVERMTADADPFLDYLLREFADRVLYFAAEDETGVNLLYHSWVASGLAKEGYSARITLWNNGAPVADLPLSDAAAPPSLLSSAMEAARGAEEPIVRRYPSSDAVHYLLMITLPDDEMVSVAVPPRHRLEQGGALARVLRTGAYWSERPDGIELLSMMPMSDHAEPSASDGSANRLRWLRMPEGWRSETEVLAGAEVRHAHLLVRVPGAAMLVVRGLLALMLLTALSATLWLIGAALVRGRLGMPAPWRTLASFRARLTLALFCFFLLPMLTFSAVAYRALSQEVVRSAASLARWSLQQVALQGGSTALSEAADRFGSDLLLYRRGVLVDAASPELVALGVFRSWLPPSVYLSFRSGEATDALDEQNLANADYLVAYRQVDEQQVLGVPIPLATGEVARRQRDLTDILMLLSLLGAGALRRPRAAGGQGAVTADRTAPGGGDRGGCRRSRSRAARRAARRVRRSLPLVQRHGGPAAAYARGSAARDAADRSDRRAGGYRRSCAGSQRPHCADQSARAKHHR